VPVLAPILWARSGANDFDRRRGKVYFVVITTVMLGRVTCMGIEKETDFQEQLGSLVEEAYENGVDVRGGWPVRVNEEDVPDWDVEIVALSSD